MTIEVNGPKIYFNIPIFGGIPVTQTVVSYLLVTIILCTAGILLGKKLKKRPGPAQVLVEKGVSMLYNMVIETMGAHNAHWAPYIGTLFLSSLLGSLIGMTGFFKSTTADLSITLTWALMTSVLIWYHTIKNNGFLGWLKGFTEPIVVMTPMNLVSEIAQPIAMAFRHFGNVIGGGIIVTVLYAALSTLSALVLNAISSNGLAVCLVILAIGVLLLVLGIQKKKFLFKLLGIVLSVLGVFAFLELEGILTGVPIFQVGLPAILSLYFDIFSGGIQAFVFCLLSMVYISSACPPPEEQAAEH